MPLPMHGAMSICTHGGRDRNVILDMYIQCGVEAMRSVHTHTHTHTDTARHLRLCTLRLSIFFFSFFFNFFDDLFVCSVDGLMFKSYQSQFHFYSSNVLFCMKINEHLTMDDELNRMKEWLWGKAKRERERESVEKNERKKSSRRMKNWKMINSSLFRFIVLVDVWTKVTVMPGCWIDF